MGLLIGVVTGVFLGCTGAGGSIIAIPLLMYFAGLSLVDASGLALGVVAIGSLFTAVSRSQTGHEVLDWRLVFLLASTAVFTAPLGRWLSFQIPEFFLLSGFCLLVSYLAIRLWRCACDTPSPFKPGARLSYPLMLGGVAVGFLSGLFGVGGGFPIVPLLRFSGLAFDRAASHSLAVVGLVSVVGFASHLGFAETVPPALLLEAAIGVVAGISLGVTLAR